jgi:hypothetical protein
VSSTPALLEPRYRNGLEKKVADQLEVAGVPFDFEGRWIHYKVPARDAKYLPDFDCPGGIILEAKGRFGGPRGNGAQERQKLILLKEQHPGCDIRIVFQNARTAIYKGSKTTYAKWADDHGFKWSDKGTVPVGWITEMKQTRKQ